MSSAVRACSKCGEAKPSTEFYKDSSKSYGHRPDCKKCSNLRVRRWVSANRIKRNRYMAAYRAVNDHKYAGTRRDWCSDNRERRRNFCRKYRASIAEYPDLSIDDWLDRIDEFNSCCAYCMRPLNEDEITLDHIRPVSSGGTHTIDNVVPACGSCNSRKNKALVFDWVARGIGVLEPEPLANGRLRTGRNRTSQPNHHGEHDATVSAPREPGKLGCRDAIPGA